MFPHHKLINDSFPRVVVDDVWTDFLRWRNSSMRMLSYCILLTSTTIWSFTCLFNQYTFSLTLFLWAVIMYCSSQFQVHLLPFFCWMSLMKSWRKWIYQAFPEKNATIFFFVRASIRSQTPRMRCLNSFWLVLIFQEKICNKTGGLQIFLIASLCCFPKAQILIGLYEAYIVKHL